MTLVRAKSTELVFTIGTVHFPEMFWRMVPTSIDESGARLLRAIDLLENTEEKES